MLAQFVLLAMYDTERGGGSRTLRSFSSPTYNARRNWYRQLVHHLREGATSGDEISDNRLTILTFNYDLSLELALETMLPDTEVHRGADYRKAVRVLHLNGAPDRDALPDRITNVGEFILTNANALHVLDERVSSEVAEVRREAVDALEFAERIFVIGFHFDPSNIEVLELGQSQPNNIFCLNFDGHLGVYRRMIALGVKEENIYSGKEDDPMYVDRALENGFLEQ